MSPEQAHGHSVDARSDIFSLGTVLYEALSGRRAFQGDTTAAVVASVLRDDPPPVRRIVPGTPRTVERCVMRCLEKEPRRRYQNALDLKAALEDVREDLTTPDPGTVDSSAKPAASRRAIRWLGWGAAALGLAAKESAANSMLVWAADGSRLYFMRSDFPTGCTSSLLTGLA